MGGNMSNQDQRPEVTVICFPKKLQIPGRPELSVFPLQVAFMAVAEDDHRLVAICSSYIPDLATYAVAGSKRSLHYNNVQGGGSQLHITFDEVGGGYVGEKVVDGRSIGLATGRDWREFFTRLAGVGLAEGERCEYRGIG
ncbi:MAG: hypothetical protein HY975_03860 [Candidatus Kerfeldbacteria bacterium]|nr:hypothetical protein [Candidatus Kerfeldbacteria bacterium]